MAKLTQLRIKSILANAEIGLFTDGARQENPVITGTDSPPRLPQAI